MKKIDRGLIKDKEGKKLNPNLAGTYRENHEKAIWGAVEAGATRKSLDSALLFEGWAVHFLEDSFAGGHLRTARRSAEELWDKKAPLFYDNMKGYVAEQLSGKLDFLAPSARLPLIRWVLNGIFEDLPRLGAGLALSVGLQHDEDNQRGVNVRLGDEIVLLKGDGALDQKTEAYAGKAVEASFQEVERAYRMGAEGSGDLNARFNHAVSALKKDGLYAAEHLIPTAILPDEQLPAADKSLPWKNLSAAELFKDPIFQEGAARFLKLKVDNFSGVLAGLPGIVQNEFKVKAALEQTLLWQMKNKPVKMLHDIHNWIPTFTGRGGAVDYLRNLARSNTIGSLTKIQRWKLMTALLSEWMTKEEAHLLRSLLLTAPADEVRELIQHFTYDRLAKELGPKFIELFNELPVAGAGPR